MFFVRSARALGPQPSSRPVPTRAACAATAPTPSRLPLRTSTHIVYPAFDLAARACVQSAAQLRHVQHHNHGQHVLRALRVCPGPPALSRPLPLHAACAATSPRPPASWLTPRPASYALFSTRQLASSFNQPLSFDTSSVTDMTSMFYVRSARALCPPSLKSARPLARSLRRNRPHTLSPPAPHLDPLRMPCI